MVKFQGRQPVGYAVVWETGRRQKKVNGNLRRRANDLTSMTKSVSGPRQILLWIDVRSLQILFWISTPSITLKILPMSSPDVDKMRNSQADRFSEARRTFSPFSDALLFAFALLASVIILIFVSGSYRPIPQPGTAAWTNRF